MTRLADTARYLSRHAFFRFAAIGACGYGVNAGVLAFDTDILHFDFQPGLGFSIFVSMCFTWLGNRYLTFRARRAHGAKAIVREWLKFMGANMVGAAVNYGVAVAVVHFAHAPFDNKFFAQACGMMGGLVFNFTLSQSLVFRGPAS